MPRCLTVHICASMWIILTRAKVQAAIFDRKGLAPITVNCKQKVVSSDRKRAPKYAEKSWEAERGEAEGGSNNRINKQRNKYQQTDKNTQMRAGVTPSPVKVWRFSWQAVR